MTDVALPLADALARLAAPDATEAWGPFGEAPLLAVDLDAPSDRGTGPGAPTLPGAVDALRARLARVPAPTVAVARDAARRPQVARWAAAFDVVVEDASALARLTASVRRAPLAAAVLVQLLRLGPWRDPEAGLVAESLAYATLQAGPEFAAWLAARRAAGARAAADALLETPGPPVRTRREGEELRITLDRPERRNAWSAAMRDGVVEALSLALVDPSVRRVVLRGAGPAFCAGGDLDEFGRAPDPATAHAVRTTRSAARLLALCAPRLRAEVHGACVGAGIELAAFADRVVARRDAFFALPELELGLLPGAGGTVSLPRRIGRQRTAWLALSGERIDAATALAWGLVDEIAPDDDGAA